jgi:hypothetical protein
MFPQNPDVFAPFPLLLYPFPPDDEAGNRYGNINPFLLPEEKFNWPDWRYMSVSFGGSQEQELYTNPAVFGESPRPSGGMDNFIELLSFHEDVTTPAAPPPPDRTASYYNRAPTVNSTTHIPWAPIDITIWSNGSVTSAVR